MKRGIFIILAAAAAGAVGFFAFRQSESPMHPAKSHAQESPSQLPELAWLRDEFELDDAEFERIAALHVSYLPTCERLCARISEARRKVSALVLSGDSVTPELEAALREEAVLRAECQTAMLGHIYTTAAALPSEKSRAYLDAMLPEVLSMTSDPDQQHGAHGHVAP